MKRTVGEELIPGDVFRRLTSVTGLGKGRTEAREPEPVGPVADDVNLWSPNQLRHTFGTLARKLHRVEAAQVLLGHAKADVTQIYAECDLGLALSIAAQIG